MFLAKNLCCFNCKAFGGSRVKARMYLSWRGNLRILHTCKALGDLRIEDVFCKGLCCLHNWVGRDLRLENVSCESLVSFT